jgi:hypothetical protein
MVREYTRLLFFLHPSFGWRPIIVFVDLEKKPGGW